MNDEELEKTKSLNDLSDLVAKETEDVLPDENTEEYPEVMAKEDAYKTLVQNDLKIANQVEKTKENLITRFKKLPKKSKIIIGVLLLGIFLGVVIITILVLSKNEENVVPKEDETPEVVIDNGNYRYEDGVLVFLNETDTQIGHYDCKNKDENLCFVAYLNNDEDDVNNTKNVYENGELLKIRSNIYHNRYVFIVDDSLDNHKIKLYDMLENKEVAEYNGLKAYNTKNKDIVILKDINDKYGLYEISSNEIKPIIESSYQYMAIIPKEEDSKIIARKANNYYLISYDNKILTKAIKEPIFDYNDDYLVTKKDNNYKVLNYDNQVLIKDYEFISLINKEYVGVVKDNMLYIKNYSNQKYNEVGYQLNNENYVPINIYDEENVLKGTSYSYKVNINDEAASIYLKNNDKTEELRLNLRDGNASKNIMYYSYLDGSLYFYKDEAKAELIGSYRCMNQNDFTTNYELNNCDVALDTVEDNNFRNHNNIHSYMLPVVANRYVFIRDNVDKDSRETKIYDLRDNKVVATYNMVSANISPNEQKLTFINTNLKIIVKNKNNKYALINLTDGGISKIYDFEYDLMERFGTQYLVKENNEYKVLYSSDSSSLPFSGKIYEISGNYVLVKENNLFYVYKGDGTKVSQGHKIIKLLGDVCYAFVDDANKIVLSTYDNVLTPTELTIANFDNEYTLFNAFSLADNAGNVIVNTFDATGNRIDSKTITLNVEKEENEENVQ